MNKSALAGFAVLLAGGFLALYFLVIKDPPKESSATPATTGSAGTTAGPTGIGPALPSGSAAPKLPQDHRSTGSQRDTAGLVLTDHRGDGSGSAIVLEGTEGSGAPARPTVSPGLVRTVHGGAKPLMLSCAAQVPAADRGPRPRIGATLKVAIRNQELAVVEVTPELSDLGGPQQKAAEDCVRSTMMSFTAPAPEEADGEGYELHYQYVVR